MTALRRVAEDWLPALPAGRLTFAHIDWFILASAIAISTLGLVTMRSFSEENAFFERQVVWIGIAVCIFFVASLPEYRFLRRMPLVVSLYGGVIFLLGLVFVFGSIVMGARERFDLGAFFVQPSDPAKVVLIVLLSKYFTRRHIEIAHIRHILISGAYAFALFVLVFFQPDLGSSLIIAAMIISGTAWNYGLQEYQKERILTFLHPLADIQGAGYNAYQSAVAVGSGELT